MLPALAVIAVAGGAALVTAALPGWLAPTPFHQDAADVAAPGLPPDDDIAAWLLDFGPSPAALPATAPGDAIALQPPPEDHAWQHFDLPPHLASTPRTHDVVVASGDTFIGVLVGLGVAPDDARAAVTALKDVFDPRRLRVGQALEVAVDPAQRRLERLVFAPSALQTLELARKDDAAFEVQVHTTELVLERALTHARVDRSVDHAARRAGAPAESVQQMLEVFRGHVDFRRQTQPGDELLLWYDRERLPDGAVMRGGDLHYARLDIGGRTLEAFRFEHDGRTEYFDRSGQSLRRFLLRQPVTGYRISSGFGMRRHPILGYMRMHNGIDFAAPTGTPIHAAGDGRLVRVGRNGGYGNYIRIDHGNGYQTAYAHLSRFARGISTGGRVRQGDLIGYVGSTGVSTGPHLHFEVIRNGRHVNPLTVAQPPATQLAGDALRRFQRHVAQIDAILKREQERTLVMQTTSTRLAARSDG